MARKKTTEEFKAQLKEIAPHLTVLGEYTGNDKKVRVLDNTCGHERNISPSAILNKGTGTICRICVPKGAKRKTHEEFKAQLKNLAPNLILLEEYQGSSVRLKVLDICGHIRTISSADILNNGSGSTCRICEGSGRTGKQKTSEQFISDLNKIAPHLTLLGEYINTDTRIKVLDTTCGHTRTVVPNDILGFRHTGVLCRVCFPKGSIKKTQEQFIADLNKIAPHLTLLEEYCGARYKVKVKGVCNHEWHIIPNNLISAESGSVCRTCTPVGRSKGEIEVAEWLIGVYSGKKENNRGV